MSEISKLRVAGTKKTRETTVPAKCPSEGSVAGTPPFAIEMGKRLAQIRGSTSQAAFARSLDIHKNTLGSYERGKSLPDAWVLVQLREIHGVSPLWLLTGIGGSHDKGMPPFDPNKHLGLIMIPELLTATMGAVDEVAAARGLSLTSQERADLTLAAYSMVNTAAKKEDIEQLSRLKANDIHGVVELVMKMLRIWSRSLSDKKEEEP